MVLIAFFILSMKHKDSPAACKLQAIKSKGKESGSPWNTRTETASVSARLQVGNREKRFMWISDYYAGNNVWIKPEL